MPLMFLFLLLVGVGFDQIVDRLDVITETLLSAETVTDTIN